ncbi:MAG: diguanylate cyclase [Chloroflexi bacterium]|nr:diguanylate cyclase [Chloroflexota bacterium]
MQGGIGHSRVRPTELATIASAIFLLATAGSPSSAEERIGLLATFGLLIGYVVVWYHVIPIGAFGRAHATIGGGIVQLIALFMLFMTGGATSPWFVFYLLPVLATVFSYRPTTTIVIATLAALGLVVVASFDARSADPATLAELLIVRLVGLGAISAMAFTITRSMRAHRQEMEQGEAQLRAALAVTEKAAMTDPLTGVHNLRALEQALAMATKRSERDQRPYSLLLVDVDRLKDVNDRSGHAAGDEALRAVANAATDVVRGYDTVARSGGDEFVIVLHDAGPDVARTITSRIQGRARERFNGDPQLTGTTITIGMATWRHGISAEALLAEADAAMYEAKPRRNHSMTRPTLAER